MVPAPWFLVEGAGQDLFDEPGLAGAVAHQAVCKWSKAAGYRLAGPRWEIYGDPDPSSGAFDVQVFWSVVAP